MLRRGIFKVLSVNLPSKEIVVQLLFFKIMTLISSSFREDTKRRFVCFSVFSTKNNLQINK